MTIYSESRQLQSALDALNREQSANCRLVAQLEAAQAQLEAANAENKRLRAELARIADLLTAEGMRRNVGETVSEVLANYITRNRLFVYNHLDPTDYQGAK